MFPKNTETPQFIKVGIVSSVNAQSATARVYFEDLDESVSAELHVLVKNTKDSKDFWLPAVEEQVLCLFLPNDETTGFILGSFYSDVDRPPQNNGFGYWVDDNNFIKWDESQRKFIVKSENPIEWVVSS